METAYHLAVLGDHLGGLAAAALAARRGERVLLLEHAASGPPLPFGLLNAVAGGPEHEPALTRFFQALGLAPFGPLGDDRIHFHALSPPLQVCLPRHRVSVHADRTARAWELQREFGDAQRALAPLVQQEEELRGRAERAAPPPGVPVAPLPLRVLSGLSGLLRLQALEREAGRRGFAAYLDGCGIAGDLRAAVTAQVLAVRRRPAGALNWAEGLRALRVAGGGLYRNAAGQSGLLEGLRAVLLARGGDARPLVALEGLDVTRAGGVRLHLSAGGTVRAGRVVVDLPLAEGLRLLPGESARALARKGIEEREEHAYGLLEFTLAAGRRPDEMGDYLVIDPGGEGVPGAAVLLAVAAAGDEGKGTCAAEALAMFPGGADDAARARVLAAVRSVLPFFDESVAGPPVWRTGAAPRFTRERIDRGRREARLAAGWRTAVFCQPPFTFLRNEDYAATPLAEALISGALAI
ncbi:MAG TPA: hypothetical protein VN317_00515 [Candidatus Methanoperedens sp.]|nr:hypothetical protein [Candidatus Methanoperedens sp.]